MDSSKTLTEPHQIFDHIPETHLASTGKFKYIAIEMEFKASSETKTFVRGDKSCPYHADILQKFIDTELRPAGLTIGGKNLMDEVNVTCPGGGRIIYEPE
jgi:hypothetical protein